MLDIMAVVFVKKHVQPLDYCDVSPLEGTCSPHPPTQLIYFILNKYIIM